MGPLMLQYLLRVTPLRRFPRLGGGGESVVHLVTLPYHLVAIKIQLKSTSYESSSEIRMSQKKFSHNQLSLEGALRYSSVHWPCL